MTSKSTGQKGFLARLLGNEAGNALLLTTAATIPLIGFVGSAVDISRAYLTRTRLQQACDAGVLAGRKSMSGITWAAANGETAEQFFHMNFPDGKYGTTPPDVDFVATSAGAVNGTAEVGVPMTLMSLFNMPTLNISVSCSADLQLPNTDIMFVLDTTLSMNDINPGDTQNRITVLRGAVQNFHTTLESVKPAGSNIRYGFVPYSSTVNVGLLLQRDWVTTKWTYDSRVEDGTYVYTSTSSGSTAGATISGTDTLSTTGTVTTGTKYQGSSEKCVAPANALSDSTVYTSWTPSSSAVPRERTRTRTRNGTTYSASLSGGICWITPTIYNNLVEKFREWVKENPDAGQVTPGTTTTSTYYHWIYKPIEYDLTALKGNRGDGLMAGGSFTVQKIANNHANRTITWNAANACIEERSTRRTNEDTTVPRYDMDVDLVPNPTNTATQWRPYLPGVVYGRTSTSTANTTGWLYSGSAETKTRDISLTATYNYATPFGDTTQYGACPSPARKLQTTSSAQLTTYLNSLTPAGFTYHDIGFLWGLRMMSRDGIFSTENRAAEASGRVARHLIFMTDGETDTRVGAYDAWGMSAVARRRTPTNAIPTNTNQNTLTETRLSELCTIAKNQKNITVWVIAFGTDLTTMLSDCASPNRAYQANNAAQLTATFSEIASQIAQLRITR